MGKRAVIHIKESLEELNILYRKTKKHKNKLHIKSLILTKEEKYKTREELANHLDISTKTLYYWTKNYKEGSISKMLSSTSGGNHNTVVTKEIKDAIEKKLNDSNNPLQGYTFAVEWVKEKFQVEINYQTLRSFMIVNFGTKLKQPRKSHYKKDEVAFEAFKKNSQNY